jgi:hypothetical protein
LPNHQAVLLSTSVALVSTLRSERSRMHALRFVCELAACHVFTAAAADYPSFADVT